MLIAPKLHKRVTSTATDFQLSVNNALVEIVKSFRYLGVILDKKLSFQNHILSIEKKIARPVGIISKLKHYVPTSILLKLYFALIHLQLLYGILVWMSIYKTYTIKHTTL